MPFPDLKTCSQNLREVPLLLRDQAELRGHLSALQKRAKRGQPVDRSLEKWRRNFDRAQDRWSAFQACGLTLDYPEDLPVSRRRDELIRAITDHPVVIVCGDTGSGKTTQLPKMMFEAGCANAGRIGVTQPRRLAAMEMARRVAEECKVPFGNAVGAKVRFDDRTSATTRIQFMTDGLLLAQLPQDPDWLEYGAILIDEAHERSLNIDFLLGCLRELVRRRPGMKVVISSATLDAERFSAFFDDAPIVTVQGRLYPIEDVFLPSAEERDPDLSDQVTEALAEVDRQSPPMDTLVFLPGEREIRETAKKLEARYRDRADILPLFARLGGKDQQRVFQSSSRRRIVLATNVAETSLTIPGIRMVIDTGLARVQRFHPQSRIQRLVTEQISRASAMQRRGRCGRTGPGICVRLYSEEDLENAPAQTDPEIRRSSLAEVILRMAVLGLPDLREFPLIDPPKGSQLNEGTRTLMDIGALDDNRNLTERGRRLASFALDPQLSRMLEEGHHEQVLPAVLIVCAFLSIQDPRERPSEKREAADTAHARFRDPGSDFLGVLNLWNAIPGAGGGKGSRAKFCRGHFLHPARVREWIHLVDDLRETCADHTWDVPVSVGEVELLDPDSLHRSLLAGIPRSVGLRGDKREFQDPKGKPFQIFPGSALFDKPPRWVMAFILLETSKLYARECAAIRPEWIEEVAPHLCRTQYERPRWNGKRGFVEADERVSLGGLMLRQGHPVHYGRVDPEGARKIFLRDGLEPGTLEGRHPSLKAYRELRDSLVSWEQKLRRPGFFLGTDALYEHLDRIVPETICTRRDFELWAEQNKWVPAIADLTGRENPDPQAFPDDIRCEGVAIQVLYRYAPDEPDIDGITWVAREQDLPRLPDALMEWIVPGYRREQIEALIRSLDKPLRLACSPIAETAQEAHQWLEEQDFAYSHSLNKALAAFLAVRTDRILAAPDLNPDRLSAHLRPKLALVNEEGDVSYEGPCFPSASERPPPGRMKSATSSGKWHRDGLTAWPEDALLQPVEHDGVSHWPALVAQTDGCGLRLYSSEREARAEHRDGVAALFRVRKPDVIGYVEKHLPIPTSVQLDLTTLPQASGDILSDLVHGILREGLFPDGNPPSDPTSYAEAEDRARGELFDVAEQRGRQLAEILTLRGEVHEAMKAPLPGDTAADLELQLQTLWSPGWCREPESFVRYSRYLEGIKLRIRRCEQDAKKDLRKLNDLDPALTLLSEALPRLSSHDLRQAFLKLQELRLATFAPELKCFEKISMKRFERWLETL